MEDNRKIKRENLMAIIYIMVVVITGISVAYAATELSSNLSITTAKVTQNPQTWAVGFDSGTVTPVSSGTSESGRVCGTATVTSSSVTVANTVLSKPGDTCRYDLVVKNTGSIDATLGTITPVTPTSTSCTSSTASMECGNITYKLTTDTAGNTLLTQGGTLANTSGTQTIYLFAQYTGTGLVTSEEVQNNGGFTLIYNQK